MKTRIPHLAAALVIAAFLLASGSANAQWPSDPAQNLPIATKPIAHVAPKITTDGTGGAIICWEDYRSPATFADIYAQRVNIIGEAQWTSDGIAVCSVAHGQYAPQIVSDGTGGAIVAWLDTRSQMSAGDIYVQRIDDQGTRLWSTDGVALTVGTATNETIRIVADGAGGAVVFWIDNRAGNPDVYAQRIDASGTPNWLVGGTPICTDLAVQTALEAAAGDGNSTVVSWYDERGNIYGQRVDGTGTIVWALDGVPIADGPTAGYSHDIAAIGSNTAVVWVRIDDAVYVQLVNGAAEKQWGAVGVTVCPSGCDPHFVQIVEAADGGAFVAWGTGSDVAASRVDASGSPLWGTNGIVVATAPNVQTRPKIIEDGAQGVILAWEDSRNQVFVPDIYAQRIDSQGVAQWAENGVVVSNASSRQWIPQLVTDGVGGAIVVWEDYRDGGSQYEEVYAQRVGADGELGVPTAVGRTPTHGSFLSAHPNPFGARTVIDYDAAGATTEISIYDVRGRHVRTLVEGRRVEGAGSVAWDGTGARGEKVPAGVYFVRMVSGAHEVTRRIVLLR